MDEIKNGELEEALFSVYTTREAEKFGDLRKTLLISGATEESSMRMKQEKAGKFG